MQYLFLALLGLACTTLAVTETCPAGISKLHGVCQTPPSPYPSAPVTVSGAKNSYGVRLQLSNRAIGPAWIDGAYRGIGADTTVANVTITRFKGTNLTRDGIAFCSASNVTIDTFSLTHSATPSTGSDLPEGIAFGRSGCGETGKSIVIRNGTISGFRSTELKARIKTATGSRSRAVTTM